MENNIRYYKGHKVDLSQCIRKAKGYWVGKSTVNFSHGQGMVWISDTELSATDGLEKTVSTLDTAIEKLKELLTHHTHYITDESENQWRVVEASDIENIIEDLTQ